MKRIASAVSPLALLCLLAPGVVHAQLGEVCAVRGQVLDEQGQPVPDVNIELEFKGESRQKLVKTMMTDKKGKFLRAGLKSGQWQFTLTKAGFKKGRFDTSLSTGGISEIPPVTLMTAPAEAAAAPGGTALPASANAGEGAAKAERIKELGDNYNKAIEALQAGRMDEAETLLKGVIAEFPDLAAAHHNLGFIIEKKGDLAGAEAEYRKAMEVQPREGASYIALATLLMRTNRETEALQIVQDASGGFAEDAKFQFALGALAFNAGKATEAEAAFSKVVELDPSHVEVQFYLGSLALGRNDVPDAIGHLEKYLASAPTGANAATAKALLATLKKAK
jgi:tetratricopeptide (TPR) repeat protein